MVKKALRQMTARDDGEKFSTLCWFIRSKNHRGKDEKTLCRYMLRFTVPKPKYVKIYTFRPLGPMLTTKRRPLEICGSSAQYR